MAEITILELQTVFERIIVKLRNESVQAVNFENDLYRIIPTECWDEFEDLSVDTGSLFDDIQELNSLAHDLARPCTYVDFDRTASVLRAISQIQNPL